MDLLGPFPTWTSGKKSIIVATDYLTCYAGTDSVHSATAAEVAEFFVSNILLRHDALTVVITHRGTAFTADLMECLMRMTHIDHRRTTAYYAGRNGLTERLNRTIAEMLSMYVDIERKLWDGILPYITFAYNTAIQETRVPPFELVFGRKVTTTLDAMLPLDEENNPSDLDNFLQRAEEARQMAG